MDGFLNGYTVLFVITIPICISIFIAAYIIYSAIKNNKP